MTTAKMNNMQQIALNSVRDFFLYGPNYEVKKLEISGNEYNNDVYVSLETGVKDDEGTMAEVYCRGCYCFNIGAKGGIYVYEGYPKIRKAYKKYYELKSIW